ncbi:hypothetical protein [Sediminibacterium ginsengisoli]|uniref:Uncharacterized protein n=1 Tax=Sediminibacterium ginsengisoli TaxID=413434 RepID=A0A1T4JP80_9BACT|nr:hypothetical protein [Sediminibacterium ginsengisoli]SJZ31931.1 hypothetical protein SAMN04488132_10111 [Sediminibacterium ginsengisoli]
MVFNKCIGQTKTSAFKKIIIAGVKNKTYIQTSPIDTARRIYLGVLTVDSASLNVISEFKKSKAASTWHGHSNVYLVEGSGKITYRIIFSFPDESPLRLNKNTFTFKHNGKLISAPYKLVGQHLYCPALESCYEVVGK